MAICKAVQDSQATKGYVSRHLHTLATTQAKINKYSIIKCYKVK